MVEVLSKATAEIVEAGFAVRCANKPVLGTFTVACERDLAFLAIIGQRKVLCSAKISLLPRIDHI